MKNNSILVADTGNNVLRLVALNSPKQIVALVGPSAASQIRGLHAPQGLALNTADDTILIADTGHNKIRSLGLDGDLNIYAGSGRKGHRDGPAEHAEFYSPQGMCTCQDGSVIVADTGNHCIRKIYDRDGRRYVTTIAGLPGVAGHRDGSLNHAMLRSPKTVIAASENADIIYVADTMNHVIRCLTRNSLSTVAGSPGKSGFKDGELDVSLFATPSGLAIEPDGRLLVCDSRNNCIRRVCFASRIVETVSGCGGRDNWGATDGVGDAARLNLPRGIAVGPNGVVWVVDSGNNCLRQLVEDTSKEPVTPGQNTTRRPEPSPNVDDANEILRRRNSRLSKVPTPSTLRSMQPDPKIASSSFAPHRNKAPSTPSRHHVGLLATPAQQARPVWFPANTHDPLQPEKKKSALPTALSRPMSARHLCGPESSAVTSPSAVQEKSESTEVRGAAKATAFEVQLFERSVPEEMSGESIEWRYIGVAMVRPLRAQARQHSQRQVARLKISLSGAYVERDIPIVSIKMQESIFVVCTTQLPANSLENDIHPSLHVDTAIVQMGLRFGSIALANTFVEACKQFMGISGPEERASFLHKLEFSTPSLTMQQFGSVSPSKKSTENTLPQSPRGDRSKDDTIHYLSSQLAEREAQLRTYEARIDALNAKVGQMQTLLKSERSTREAQVAELISHNARGELRHAHQGLP